MRTKRMTLLAALAAALLTAGVAEAKSDSWITAKVKSKLAAAKDVGAFGTNVDTRDGVVTLRGEVDTEAEKSLAGRHAGAVEGVKRVDNQLIVRGDREREDTGVFDGDARDAGDDPREKVEQKGWGDRALGGIDDAAITARVKSALAGTRGTKALKTNVTTREGTVTLSGNARSESERELAEEVAKGVNGVKSVDNQIQVR
jgi:hyperosmotically inducible periplasmic protein